MIKDADMPLDTPTTAPTHVHRRFLWLVLLHIVLGLTGACVAYSGDADVRPSHWVGAFFGLVVSQTSLLGVWVGLGMSPWWKKLIGVVVGVSFLFPLLGIGIDDVGSVTFAFVAMATSFVAMPLLILRLFRVAIHLDSVSVAPTGRIQFSIRHLMILTSVIACLISIGKLVPPRQSDALLMALTYSVVGVLPVWFVLATKRPAMFSIGLVAVGACAGYCLGRRFLFGDEVYMTSAAVEAIAVVVSLLVVRSCGYRLVRLPSRHQANKLAEDAVVHSGPL